MALPKLKFINTPFGDIYLKDGMPGYGGYLKNDCFLTYCGDGIVKTSGANVEECDGGFGDAIPITGPCTD